MTSTWELALRGRLRQLDPALATPRRWLWPVFAVLTRAAIAFPRWERDVPFEVANVPGEQALRATVAFGFRDGPRQHVDVTMTAPVVGRIYAYAGSFGDRIEAG